MNTLFYILYYFLKIKFTLYYKKITLYSFKNIKKMNITDNRNFNNSDLPIEKVIYHLIIKQKN